MKHFTILFFVFFFYYLQCNCIPQVLKEKNNSRKDISIDAHSMFKSFTANDGLPQSVVNCLAVDHVGRLWIGTQDGAAYYNGENWNIVNMPNRKYSNYVLSITISEDSTIWFGTSRGWLYQYKNDNWMYIDSSKGLMNETIWSVFETKNNKREKITWIGTSNGIYKYYKGKITPAEINTKIKEPLVVYQITQSSDYIIWFASNQGLIKYNLGSWEFQDIPKEFNEYGVRSMFISRSNKIWLGGNGIIASFDRNSWKIYKPKSSLAYNLVNVIYQTSDDVLWFGFHDRILTLKTDFNSDEYFEYFIQGADYSEKMSDIFSIVETPKNVIWFASLQGLHRYVPGKWKKMNEQYTPGKSIVNCIYESTDNDYYFGTMGGLFIFSKGKWFSISMKNGLKHNYVYSVIEKEKGDIWIATNGGGINRYYKGKWIYYDKEQGLPDNRITSLFKSSDGTIWASSWYGVVYYKDGLWNRITSEDGLISNFVMSIAEGKDGSMWFGTRTGVSNFKNGKFNNYTVSDGLASNIVHSIYISNNGNLWCGTLSNGVSCFNPYNKNWITFNESSTPSLSNNVVYGIKEDYKNRLYLLTNKGVDRLTPEPDFDKNNFGYSVDNFNIEDGLQSNEGQVRSIFVDSKGRIWVGTIKGAAFYNPYTELKDTSPKRILITNLLISQRKSNDVLKSGMNLSYDQNNIVFDFSLLSFYKESDNRFKVQLVGLDKYPLPWTSNFKKEYTNLSPGNYIFKIWGKDYTANISGPLEFQFTILPPFWMSWWFGTLTALLLVCLIYISIKRYIYYKVKKRLVYLERAQLLERERTRISQDMHDSIGSNLTRIVVLSELLNDDLSKESSKSMVSLISKKVLAVGEMAREIIDTMNEIIWSINPIYDNLENLVNYMTKLANETLEVKKINSKLNISEKIPAVSITPEFRRNLYLIFKEALNNIIKHSEANEVEINILVEANSFIFSIQDNGVGFTENFKNSSMKLHMGIENMKKRALFLDGELKIEAIPGFGTRINFCQTKLDKYII